MSRLTKLTDLFQEGTVAVLKGSVEGENTEVVVWLNKLSPFEAEQAAHEGRIARARIMLAINEIGTPESDVFRVVSDLAEPPKIIDALLAAKDNERDVKIIRELHSDKDWKERLETLEWSSEQLAGKPDDDPEVLAVTKVLEEYQEEMDKRTGVLRAQARMELAELPEDRLRELHRLSYAEQQGINAFLREQAKSQVFYSLRVCEGVRENSSENGSGNVRWHHENCDHSQRWLDDRSEVDGLPEPLLTQFQAAYDQLNMPPDVARFWGGPASSSESRGPSSKPGESKESGPEVTSDELVTTSS